MPMPSSTQSRPNCARAMWLPFSPMADSAASMRSYPNDCTSSGRKHNGALSQWGAHRGSEGADARTGKHRSGANLHFHVESHLQSRSAHHVAADPAPNFGDGEERIVPRSNSRKDHADRFARAG